MSLNSFGSRLQSFAAEYWNVFCPLVDLAVGMFNNESPLMLASKFWIFLVRPHQAAFFNWQMLEQPTSIPKATIILVSSKNRASIIQSSRSPLMGSWERLLSLRMFRNHHWIFECMYTIKPEQEVPASGVWFCPVSYKFGHCWLEVLRRRLLQCLKYQNILS